MNRYGTAIILTGLSIILLNNSAIAIERTVNLNNSCQRIARQTSHLTNTIKTDIILNYPHTVASVKSTPDIYQSSFWWAAKQFDPFNGKLIQQWLTYPQQQQVNLTVNWRLWTLLDYFGRYRFVNQFGTVARKYGYSLNIFNQKEQCLASYQYNTKSIPPKWELNLEKLGRDSLPIESQPIIIEEEF